MGRVRRFFVIVRDKVGVGQLQVFNQDMLGHRVRVTVGIGVKARSRKPLRVNRACCSSRPGSKLCS